MCVPALIFGIVIGAVAMLFAMTIAFVQEEKERNDVSRRQD